MITMTIDEISARDMRKTAIHECGHACVVRHFGMWAQPDIWRNESANPSEEMMWFGKTRYYAINRTPLRHRRIAIAGIVAGLMDDPDFEVECLEENFTESFMCDEWSLTDREGAIGWTLTDLRSVHSILRRNWKAIEEEAECLINMWTEHHSVALALPHRRGEAMAVSGVKEEGHQANGKSERKGSRSPRVVTKDSGFMQGAAVIHPSGAKQ